MSRGTFLRIFFSQNHINWHCERKNSAGLVRTAFYFSGELLSKTILKVVDLVFFVVLARLFKHGLPKLYSTCPEAFLRNFFHRIILIDTVSEKIQLVLSELHFTFPGNFWAKQLLFFSPCQAVQAWVTKTVFYVSRGIFVEFFSQNHINWHCERKNSAAVVKTAFYFSGELLSRKILEVVVLVFF